MDRIQTVYLATHPDRDPEALARAIALEQTVEVIEELVPDALRAALVGRVESVSAAGDGRWQIRISYAAEVAAGSLSQLLQLLFGNISFYPRLRLVDLELPSELSLALGGPRFGVEGIRRLTGVHGRALLATALKPRGSTPRQLADIAYRFAAGGGDLLKDDQNLVEEDFEDFKQRVDRCADAVERANQRTGRRCLYFPHVTGAGDELLRRADFIHSRGIPGILTCPFVLGVEHTARLAADRDLVLMTHPAMGGAYSTPVDHGITAPLLFGTLLRLAGADISVFAGPGGRISTSHQESAAIVDHLRRTLADLPATLPCPAGGKTLDLLPALARELGPDCAILVGGDLLRAREQIEVVTRRCIEQLTGIHPARNDPPAAIHNPGRSADDRTTGDVLVHTNGFDWQGRDSTAYKSDESLPFSDVRKVELFTGRHQRIRFDLRYIELAPGGYTSLEKHLHTHVIIGARGHGVLMHNNRQHGISAHDIAYVPPLAIHQLRNDSQQPFGFYCLVDSVRDRPMAPSPIQEDHDQSL